MSAAAGGPLLVAYDGSELAKYAIEQVGGLLNVARELLVVCVWETFDVGFVPVDETPFDAKQAGEVRAAAERTAAAGAALAENAGFRARGLAIEAAPTWKGLVQAADEHSASAIVLGSHGRGGVAGVLIGSVADAVTRHWDRTVMIVHRPD